MAKKMPLGFETVDDIIVFLITLLKDIVNLQFLTPRSNGNGFDVVKNIHVPLIDD